MAVQEKINNIQNEKDSFYLEILKDYKRSNKVKDIVIFVLIGVITLFVAGLIYLLTNYDFSFDYVETETGTAVINKGDSNNAESNISVHDKEYEQRK